MPSPLITMTSAKHPKASETSNHGAVGYLDPMDVDVDTPIRIRPRTQGQWEKQCPKCSRWVGIGLKGSLYSFMRHLDACRLPDESHEHSVASTSFVPEPLPPFAIPPIQSYPRIPLPEPTSCQRPSGPSELPPAQLILPHLDVPIAAVSPFCPSHPFPPSSPLDKRRTLLLPYLMQ